MSNRNNTVNTDADKCWRDERAKLYQRISQFCSKNKIGFCQEISSLEHKITHGTNTVIVYMLLFDRIPGYHVWKNINQLCQQYEKKVLVVTDNIIDNTAMSGVEFFSYPKLLGVTSLILGPVNSAPSRLYNCFVNRTCSVRQSWFYFFHHHNLLDKGYVSLLMDQESDYSELTGVDLFDHIHQHYQLDQLPHFEKAYRATRSQIPYRNFNRNQDLLPLILDSKYSLALETYANADPGVWCFTEKSLRSLQCPTISLLFLQEQGYTKLRELGFEFESSLLEIDRLPWQQRQQRLLEILVNDSLDFDVDKLYNQSQHNQQLLQSWKTQYQREDFFEDFYAAATS